MAEGQYKWTVTQTREVDVWAETAGEAAAFAEAAFDFGVTRHGTDALLPTFIPDTLRNVNANLIDKPVVTRLTTRLD